MKDTARAKGLGDLRTVTTHHIPAKPPRKGTTYLDLFALSMEKQRLEQELAGIERRRQRVLNRLAEVGSSMEKLVEAAREEKAAAGPSEDTGAHQQAVGERPVGRQWKKMTMEY